MNGSYPDYAERQLLLAVAQMDFDYGDPTTAAAHEVNDPLPGTPKKQIILQMSVNDSQVPNLSSYYLARTMGIPLMGPSVIDVYGMPPQNAPLPSALTTWDVHPMPAVPLTNETPETDNGAHGAIHKLPALQAMIDAFYQTGMVQNTCNGKCDFPPM